MASSPYIPRNANSEWAPIIKAQADYNRAAELEEIKAKELSKRIYAEELERQLAYKRQRQQDEGEIRRRETDIMRQREQAIKDFDRRVREDKGFIQQKMAHQYETEQQLKSMRTEAERREWLNAEQDRLRRVHDQMQQETQRLRQFKDSVVKAEQNEYAMKLLLKQQQNLEHEREKLNEQARITDEQQKQMSRERQRRDYYQNLHSKLDNRTQVYSTVSQADAERNMEKAYLERHWEETVKKRQDQRFQQETMQKYAAQQATNDFLGLQMQIKQEKQQQALQEYEQEKYEARARAEQVRAMQFQQKQLSQQEQERLKVSLESQITEQGARRYEDLKMSERERQLHMGLLQRQDVPPTFKSVPGVHPREIPLQKVLPRFAKSSSLPNPMETQANYQTSSYSTLPKGLDVAARDFYGLEPESASPQLNQMVDFKKQANLEFSYDPRRHDPIINPIGSVIPRPLLGQNVRKGRGLSMLGAAGSSTLNR